MDEKITFWLGCNVLRHGDIIHACVEILRRLDIDAITVGGPAYCCGTVQHANTAASGGMGRRTTERFNQIGRDKVVSWCPACSVQADRFMKNYNETHFTVSHLTKLLYEKRDRLAELCTHSIERRVVVHTHHDLGGGPPVDVTVPALLRCIPGLEVMGHDVCAPGQMCTDALESRTEAMRDMVANITHAAETAAAGTIVTVYHACQRKLCVLERAYPISIVNYVTLLAKSMGLNYEDSYKTWVNTYGDVRGLIGETRINGVGAEAFERVVLPELVKKPSY
jgi:Fe-S oxidoreductase